MPDFDVVIVGAGAVGLACGYATARRGRSVLIVEKAARIGAGVSSRNSEVIHSGFYYPPGSLRARFCVEGRRALYPFLTAHNVAHEKCGKLLVAADESEREELNRIAARAEKNGVEGMRRLSGEEARALEPELRAAAALEFSESGVLDAHGYMDALEGEIASRGGAVVLNSPFLGATRRSDLWSVRIGGAEEAHVTAGLLIIAAGLSAQACAKHVAGYNPELAPPLYLGKGHYFSLQGAKAPFRRLIYPMPIPGALGTHYRRDLGGVARFGPDLDYVDVEDYRVDPARAESFYAAIRKFWPGLPDNALAPDYAGIRPKLHGPHEPQPDFVIQTAQTHGLAELICLFGIESPGLTSSLAIGDYVAGLSQV